MSPFFSPNIPATPAGKRKSARITVIDILRGFALLGMILTHSFDSFWHQTRLIHGDGFNLGTIDSLFDLGSDVFLVRKFFTIFSFLFGLGFAMQFQSAKEKGQSLVGRFIWRLLILLMIGTVLNLTINAGKILQTYALLGLVLLFSHTWKKNTLLYLAMFFFSLNLFISLYSSGLIAWAQTFVVAPLNKTGFGSLHIIQGLFTWLAGELFSGRLLMETSLFLFGQYVGRKNVFTENVENRILMRKVAWRGGIIAFVATAALAIIKMSGITVNPAYYKVVNFELAESYLKLIQQTSMSFFYIAVIVTAYNNHYLQKILIWLEPAGKMALTTFIIQAVFILFLHKLQFVQEAGLAATISLGFVFFILQLLFAAWWMSRFRQGPVEWFWRTLTYLEWQPVKKKAPVI